MSLSNQLTIKIVEPVFPVPAATFYLAGTIGENADLSVFYNQGFPAIIIDLEKVTRINSYGTKLWVMALKKLAGVPVTLQKCSIPFVDQMSILPELTTNTLVKSVLLPYFCPKCEGEIARCIEIKKLAQVLVKHKLNKTFRCSECETALEFYEDEELYFTFMPALAKNLHLEQYGSLKSMFDR